MREILCKYFQKIGEKFCTKTNEVIKAILKCGKANTYDIAREMCTLNGKNFKTNDVSLYRFLQDGKFQIDDAFWRCHAKLLFDLMKEQKFLKYGDKIPINIDFTTCNDDFLILSASVVINDKAVMLYFTMRNYPKRKNSMSQKKMEEAFIKGLRHVLSKKYEYIIVADRGFGNIRFAELCEKNNFDYVLRINSNLNIEISGKINKLADFNGMNTEFVAHVKRWEKDMHFCVKTEEKSTWFLLTNVKDCNSGEIYEKRFKIEKYFQDQKSSGFDIEKTKIRKYDRFKRLFYLIGLSHMFAVFLGNFLLSKDNTIKKNFPLHTDAISVFLNLEFKHSSHFLGNLLSFSVN